MKNRRPVRSAGRHVLPLPLLWTLRAVHFPPLPFPFFLFSLWPAVTSRSRDDFVDLLRLFFFPFFPPFFFPRYSGYVALFPPSPPLRTKVLKRSWKSLLFIANPGQLFFSPPFLLPLPNLSCQPTFVSIAFSFPFFFGLHGADKVCFELGLEKQSLELLSPFFFPLPLEEKMVVSSLLFPLSSICGENHPEEKHRAFFSKTIFEIFSFFSLHHVTIFFLFFPPRPQFNAERKTALRVSVSLPHFRSQIRNPLSFPPLIWFLLPGWD